MQRTSDRAWLVRAPVSRSLAASFSIISVKVSRQHHPTKTCSMNDLATDTTLEPRGPNAYRAVLSPRWTAFGIHGGYLAAIAARAAGASAALPRPASVTCHFIAPAQPGEVDVVVEPLQRALRVERQRVTLRQDTRDILHADIWTAAAELPGPSCAWQPAPDVPRWQDVPLLERVGGWRSAPLWNQIEIRDIPVAFQLPGGELAPRNCGWARIRPRACFGADTWLHVARLLITADHCQFPAVAQRLTHESFIAPTLYLHLALHAFAPDDEWLLTASKGVGAADGLLGTDAHIWSSDGALLASSSQQMLFTRMRVR
jgi:acyl-CoA thioesterase